MTLSRAATLPLRLAARPLLRVFGPALEHERLLMISISTVLVMAGQGVVAPVLPLYARDFGVGAATIGLTLSVFALARLILNIPLGLLSDRYGRRLLLVGGPIVTGAGMIGSGSAGNIETLLAWRFVAGAGSAMYMTGAMAYLADISTPENRGRFIGINQAALLMGTSLGPAVGGTLAALISLRAPFYFVGGAAMIACAYAYLRLPETRVPAPPRGPAPASGSRVPAAPQRAWVQMVRSRDFGAVALVTMAIFFTRTASRQTLVPLIAAARLGWGAGSLGGLFTGMSVINAVLITPSAVAADRFGRKAVIVPSGLVMALALALFAAADAELLFLAAAGVLAVGSSMAGPAPAAFAADIAPPHARGLAMGLYRTSGDLGFVIGPPLLGWLSDQTSFAAALSANAVLIAAAVLIFGLLARETVRARKVASTSSA